MGCLGGISLATWSHLLLDICKARGQRLHHRVHPVNGRFQPNSGPIGFVDHVDYHLEQPIFNLYRAIRADNRAVLSQLPQERS